MVRKNNGEAECYLNQLLWGSGGFRNHVHNLCAGIFSRCLRFGKEQHVLS